MVLGGIDLGGTKIGVSLGDRDGQVLAQDRFDTDQSQGPDDLLGEAVERLRKLCVAQGLSGSEDLAELDAAFPLGAASGARYPAATMSRVDL